MTLTRLALRLRLATLILWPPLWTCTGSREVNLSPAAWPEGELQKYSEMTATMGHPKTAVEGRSALITGTSGALAVRAGLEALKQGGSAADAAMTTALAQVTLALGSWVSFAGLMNMIYYDAATETVHTMNASFSTVKGETEPLTIPFCPMPSGRTALVPGFFAGVQAAHHRFGKLPFEALFQPAIYFAERGIEVSERMGRVIEFRKDVLSRLPATKRVFIRADGEFYAEGDVIRQPELAATLRQVASTGVDYIYRGGWAQHFVDAVRADGGKMNLDDLASYRVIWGEPVRTTYRGYDVFATGAPNFGGTKLLEALNLWELAEVPGLTRYWESVDALYGLTQIAHLGYVLGPQGGGTELPDAWLQRRFPGIDLSLSSRATKATSRELWGVMRRPDWLSLKQEAVAETKQAQATSGGGRMQPPGHSDAIAVVDSRGNVAALSHSINTGAWGATGIFVDGISIPDAACFQQEAIRRAGPGERLQDPSNPLMVVKDGVPVIAGSSVGVALTESTLQILINLIDYDADPQAALDAPQFYRPDRGEHFAQPYPEEMFAKHVVDGLRTLGERARRAPIAALARSAAWWVSVKRDSETGVWRGGTIQRENGLTIGY